MYTAEIISITADQASVVPIIIVTVQYSKDNDVIENIQPIRTSSISSINPLIQQQLDTFTLIDSINAYVANPTNPGIGPWTAPS